MKIELNRIELDKIELNLMVKIISCIINRLPNDDETNSNLILNYLRSMAHS